MVDGKCEHRSEEAQIILAGALSRVRMHQRWIAPLGRHPVLAVTG